MKTKNILKLAKQFFPRWSEKKLRRLIRHGKIGGVEVEYTGIPIFKSSESTVSKKYQLNQGEK